MQQCPGCNGMGHFDTWGKSCPRSSMHCKQPCGVCNGNGTVMGHYDRCGECEGMGGKNTWGKACRSTDMHFVSKCPFCNGGYRQAGHHHHHHHHQHQHHHHHASAQIAGAWSEFPPSANNMTIAQMGDKVTVTCPSQPWSPAHANITGTTIRFVSGMPAGLSATFDPMSQRMNFTNGVVWTKGGAPPAPVPMPVPVMPVPVPVAAAQVAGQWNEQPASQNVMAITQLGDKVTVACPTQPWSPAHADVSGNTLIFRSGMPAGMTATFDAMTRSLAFSNGIRWVMGSPLDGTWVDHPHAMSAVVSGSQISVHCPTQPWSPATGTVNGNNITFTTGMPGLSAVYDPTMNHLAFSNGCRWQKA